MYVSVKDDELKETYKRQKRPSTSCMYVSVEDDSFDQQMQPRALSKLPPTKAARNCAQGHDSEGSGEVDGVRRAERKDTGDEGLGIEVLRATVRVSCMHECMCVPMYVCCECSCASDSQCMFRYLCVSFFVVSVCVFVCVCV